jgi:hypothetical protein
MPILSSTPTKTPVKPGLEPTTPPADTELPTFRFVVGWTLLIVLLVFANQTRLGHVILYYSLLLMILLIIVSEYQRIVPLLNFQTPGQLGSVS